MIVRKEWDGQFCTECRNIIRIHDEAEDPCCGCHEDEWPFVETHWGDEFPDKWIKARFRLEVRELVLVEK